MPEKSIFLTGGGEMELGYSKSICEKIVVDNSIDYVTGAAYDDACESCWHDAGDSAFSLGVAVSF